MNSPPNYKYNDIKRCHWYDDNGRPYRRIHGGQGCFRPIHCTFAHPFEKELWEIAFDGGDPPLHLLADEERRLESHPEALQSNASVGTAISGIVAKGKQTSISLDPKLEDYGSTPALAFQPPPPLTPAPPLPDTTDEAPTSMDVPVAPHERSPELVPADENLKMWMRCVQLLSEAVTLHQKYLALDRELYDRGRLANIAPFCGLSESDRANLQAYMDSLESQRADKAKALNALVARLAEAKSDFWPIPSGKRTAMPGGEMKEAAEKLDSLEAPIVELRHTLATIQSDIHRILSAVPSDQEPGTEPTQDGTSVDQPQRRSAVPVVLPEEVEKIYDMLLEMEDRLSDLENDLLQHDNDMADEMNELITERIHILKLALPPPAPRRRQISQEQLRAMEALEQSIAVSEEQVAALTQDMAELSSHSEAVNAENANLKLENELLRKQIQMLRQRDEELDRMQGELRALNTAVSTYISTDAVPPLHVPSADELLQGVMPYLAQSVRTLINPYLLHHRGEIQECLRAQSAEVESQVTSKLVVTQQMVEAIHSWVNRLGGSGGAAAGPRTHA
ncbi:hypothetical protein A0H81_02621 [Grifola frondosa]|uniref:Uncharacterized protein n=1 Tax=Grifola frondosa TaxID=5627 RepID=A0A1C7MMN7_GRIFR|nr:hypothetical protein A0H81_02621 [Grifola frondosa]